MLYMFAPNLFKSHQKEYNYNISKKRDDQMSKIIKTYMPQRKMEGAGVLVNRVFGYYQVPAFDPFLMLDYFENENAKESPGFPWHPHKGIETITYMLRGRIKHEDSLGNGGIIGPGDVQWMTAGKGIYHQEMPQTDPGGYRGFQFWLNMPAHHKLDKPRYNGLTAKDIKSVKKNGADVKIISGEYGGILGPIDKSNLGVRLMHVKIDAGKEIVIAREKEKNGFVFVFEGEGAADERELGEMDAYTLAEGDIEFKAKNKPFEFIFAEGYPINEPIVWYGPMVMNTNSEIQQALKDLRDGTFV